MRLHHRITAATATAALALSAAFVAAAPATATDSATSSSATTASTATFDGLSITGLKKKIKLPKAGKRRTVTFQVNISGTPSDGGTDDVNGDGLKIDYKAYDVDYAAASITRVKSRVNRTSRPFVTSPVAIAPGANSYSFELSSAHDPGIYELRVPVTQINWTTLPHTKVVKVVTKRFQIHATKKLSKATTTPGVSRWTIGKTATFTLTAPTYQRGAKVTMYFKKNGTKKFKKIKTVKLKGKATAYTSKATVKTKAVQTAGTVQFRVAKAKWAPAYKARNMKIQVTEY